MGILRDYYCESHGIFEAWEPTCPMKHCKSEISIVHLKPVGTKSDKTKRTDKSIQNLALDFNMTDVKSTKEGEHQTGYLVRNNTTTQKELAEAAEREKAAGRPGDAAIWGGGGNISMKSVLGGQFKPVADEAVGVNPKSAGNLTGPRASTIINDHDNLQIKP